ncbi:DUF3696 domain-containing protein [Candidatus Poribacteria bacterium]|nr:DUF3696 domain-containing protein [Candidatus Poribacteria bacterium]
MDSDLPEVDSVKQNRIVVHVQGFKSLYDQTSIEIRPLTVLAGQNSSGKSSIMQPLLLMKQTLDPDRYSQSEGDLRLSGALLNYSLPDNFLSRIPEREPADMLNIGFTHPNPSLGLCLWLRFERADAHSGKLVLTEMRFSDNAAGIRTIHPRMSADEIIELFGVLKETVDLRIEADRCFLTATAKPRDATGWHIRPYIPPIELWIEPWIRRILYVRGNRRDVGRYPILVQERDPFPGTFDEFTASVVAAWHESNDPRTGDLTKQLRSLELASDYRVQRIDGMYISIQIARMPKGEDPFYDNLYDVGIGVRAVLPVLVALLFAERGRAVYLEHPELHLHPKAQWNLAKCLADAAKRGVQVIVETHSDLLLLGIQTLVAKGELSPDLVKLHWFKREDDGRTAVDSRDLDKRGRFGDWPEDFGEVTMKAQRTYLDAQRTHRDR